MRDSSRRPRRTAGSAGHAPGLSPVPRRCTTWASPRSPPRCRPGAVRRARRLAVAAPPRDKPTLPNGHAPLLARPGAGTAPAHAAGRWSSSVPSAGRRRCPPSPVRAGPCPRPRPAFAAGAVAAIAAMLANNDRPGSRRAPPCAGSACPRSRGRPVVGTYTGRRLSAVALTLRVAGARSSSPVGEHREPGAAAERGRSCWSPRPWAPAVRVAARARLPRRAGWLLCLRPVLPTTATSVSTSASTGNRAAVRRLRSRRRAARRRRHQSQWPAGPRFTAALDHAQERARGPGSPPNAGCTPSTPRRCPSVRPRPRCVGGAGGARGREGPRPAAAHAAATPTPCPRPGRTDPPCAPWTTPCHAARGPDLHVRRRSPRSVAHAVLGPRRRGAGLRVGLCFRASATVAQPAPRAGFRQHWYWLPATAVFLVKPDLGPLVSGCCRARTVLGQPVRRVRGRALPAGGAPVRSSSPVCGRCPVAARHFAAQTTVVLVLALVMVGGEPQPLRGPHRGDAAGLRDGAGGRAAAQCRGRSGNNPGRQSTPPTPARTAGLPSRTSWASPTTARPGGRCAGRPTRGLAKPPPVPAPPPNCPPSPAFRGHRRGRSRPRTARRHHHRVCACTSASPPPHRTARRPAGRTRRAARARGRAPVRWREDALLPPTLPAGAEAVEGPVEKNLAGQRSVFAAPPFVPPPRTPRPTSDRRPSDRSTKTHVRAMSLPPPARSWHQAREALLAAAARSTLPQRRAARTAHGGGRQGVRVRGRRRQGHPARPLRGPRAARRLPLHVRAQVGHRLPQLYGVPGPDRALSRRPAHVVRGPSPVSRSPSFKARMGWTLP
ncbi:hypothetical protein SVIOM342S_08786 [Streptomyces violaceorubidus]